MKSIKFKGHTIAIGSEQPEYNTLYAARVPGGQKEGEVVMVFKLTKEEVEEITRTGKIYYHRLTFNQSFQPMRLDVEPPPGINCTPL